MTDVSIIIVSWNSGEYLPGCISALPAGAGGASAEVIVVDNASTDASPELVRSKFPAVTLLANTVNRGFAAANNQGLARARGRYCLLLNPDTRAHEGAIEKMTAFMDAHPEAGACGCLLVGEDGSVEHAVRRFPTFSFAFGAKTILGRLGLFRESYDSVKMRGVALDSLMEVDQPSGAALFLRQSVLEEVGLLDERFFMFFEEVDLCRRIKDAGYKIYFYPQARITHYGGRSRRQIRSRAMGFSAESLVRYLRKHEGRTRGVLFELAFRPLFALGVCADAAGAGVKALAYRLRGRSAKAGQKRELFRAYCEFIRRDLFPFLLRLWE